MLFTFSIVALFSFSFRLFLFFLNLLNVINFDFVGKKLNPIFLHDVLVHRLLIEDFIYG